LNFGFDHCYRNSPLKKAYIMKIRCRARFSSFGVQSHRTPMAIIKQTSRVPAFPIRKIQFFSIK
jgi:hypothetical protein